MKIKTDRTSNLRSVFTALFAALICAGSLFAIPLGPVPLVLQNAFAILAGLLLGPIQGAGAVGLFLLAGALGLPVFSGGRGGIAVLVGPTGGYLAGYFIGALVAGFLARRRPQAREGALAALPSMRIAGAAIAGFICIYIPGVSVLRSVTGMSFTEAVARGLTPFLIPDLIKIAALIPITLRLKPVVDRYLFPEIQDAESTTKDS